MSRRWSYKVVQVKPGFFGFKARPMEEALAQLGQQGWELVSVVYVGIAAQLYLKKEL